MQNQILAGVRVLDLTRVLAGPWCTQALADMGATVYKIERADGGDEMRQSPPFITSENGKESVSYLCVNRGKQSITVDVSHPQGQALLRDLAAQCDVMVENFKAGDLARYGLDYATVRARNPSIVYCSITGYGQDGPMAAQPGYDPVFQAISGIMSTCGIPDGEPGGGPMRSIVPMVDVMTGMVATSSILAALLHQRATGTGQFIDVALLDVAFAATVHLSQTYLATGQVPPRVGNGSFLFAPSNCFPCRDGHIFIQIGNDGQWRRLAQALQKPEWLEDERLLTNAARVRHKDLVNASVSLCTREWDKQVLSDALGAAGVPSGPVNDMAQAFAHPQVQHRGLRMEIDHPTCGRLAQVRSPFRFSETPVRYAAPPALGAHTEAVLSKVLGMAPDTIASLRDARVV